MSGFDELKQVITNVINERVESSKNTFICTIKSVSPLIINNFMLGDISESHLKILYSTHRRIKEDIKVYNTQNGKVKKVPFNVGDTVLVTVAENGDRQYFIIIDKVVNI